MPFWFSTHDILDRQRKKKEKESREKQRWVIGVCWEGFEKDLAIL